MQTTHGCGDLIFSSHTTFALVGMLTYTEYGAILIIKVSDVSLVYGLTLAPLGTAYFRLYVTASLNAFPTVDAVWIPACVPH